MSGNNASDFFLSGSAIYTDQTVEILDLIVPRFPKTGEDAVLTCRFRLGGPKHKLYTVNWWRGKDQFYTYKKNTFQPKNAYAFRGINVNVRMISFVFVENATCWQLVLSFRVLQVWNYECLYIG